MPDDSQSPQGGAGGAAVPFRQMEKSRGIREQRMRRMIARTRLKLAKASADHADGVGESLQTLRDMQRGDGDKAPDPRQARLAASDLLHHYRDVSKMGGDEAPADAGVVNVLNVTLAPDGDSARADYLEAVLQRLRESGAASAKPPEQLNGQGLNGHAGNGSA